jgi:hypothetical protein
MEPVILVLPVAIGLIYAFVTGCRAINHGLRQDGDHAHALYLLGINACEPLVNVFLIPGAALGLDGLSNLLGFGYVRISGVWLAVLITLPMMIVLTPIYSLFFQDRWYRSRSLRLLPIGMVRWVLTIMIFVAAFDWESVVWSAFFIVLGTIALFFSARWAEREYRFVLYAPQRPATIRGTMPRDQGA